MNHYRDNRVRLDTLVAQAEQAVDAGAFDEAIGHLSTAATLAWKSHTGVFLDRRIESLLARIAQHVNTAFAITPRSTAPVGFLMTSIHTYGGHSKIAWRWMQLDQEHTFHLVLTAQKQYEMPEQLTELIDAGRLTCVTMPDGNDVLQHIRDVRDQLAGAGMLVMNIHPDDVISAVVAACLREMLRIVYIDHAFFSFSLGMTSAHALCCTSPAAVAIATQERLVSPEHLAWYRNSPEWFGQDIPTDGYTLREQLGIPAEAPLLLSSGSEHKYYPVRGLGLLDLVAPVLDRVPNAHLVVIGIWQPVRFQGPLLERFAQRVHLLRPVSERELLHFITACDIYLDSVPNHSGGGAQQAMLLSKPTLGYADPLTYRAHLAPQFFSVDDFSWIHFSDRSYRSDLEALIDDPALRQERGRFLQAQVSSRINAHDNLASIQAIYRKARQAPLVADTLLDESLRVENPALHRMQDEITRSLNVYRSPEDMTSAPAPAPTHTPSAARQRYEQAAALMASGYTEEGTRELIALASEGTPIWEVYADLAEIAQARNDHEAALDLMLTAAQRAPHARRAALGAAMLQVEYGAFEPALASLSPYLRHQPNDADALPLVRRILGMAPELSPVAWARLTVDLRTPTAEQLRKDTRIQELERELRNSTDEARRLHALIDDLRSELQLPRQKRVATGLDVAWQRIHALSDKEWLNVLLRSVDVPSFEGFPMPGFPSEALQVDMVGSSNDGALREGMIFYREVRDLCAQHGRNWSATDRLLDFGTGWGRYARIFMKDFHPDKVVGVDVDESYVQLCRQSFPYASFETVTPLPPSSLPDASFDLVIAYSVFSHLAQHAADAWIDEFARVLRPGGIVAITTQGRSFLETCERMRARDSFDHPWHHNLARSFVDRAAAEAAYDAGEFLFSATGGGDTRPSTFYGEALVPPEYVTRHWSDAFELLEYVDDRRRLPQALILMRKKSTQ